MVQIARPRIASYLLRRAEHMKINIRYWQSVLQEAERELDAATGNITLKAAAKRYMRAKAEVRRLEAENPA